MGKLTYKTIFRDVNKLIISSVHMRHLKELSTVTSVFLSVLGNKCYLPELKLGEKELAKQKDTERTHIAVVGGRNNIFELFAIEYVDSHKVTLGMAVLAGFRGGDFDNLFTY